ncbi:MAG TPA: hypothetical protein VMV46_16805 [Thermoanaerobaculia bacterium]|nr:hypothetical protein [Thermoanaerobaculia bacterium]
MTPSTGPPLAGQGHPPGADPQRPIEPGSGTPGCVKLFLGCALGCGALALIACLIGALFAWWLVRPGKQYPTAAVVPPDVAGAFHVGDLGADPGVVALLDHLLREMRRQDGSRPDWYRDLEPMRWAGGSPSAGLRLLLPREATLSLDAVAGEEPALVAALNPRGLVRVLRMIVRASADESRIRRHRGHQIVPFEEGGGMALVDGTVLLTDREQSLESAIDRLLDGGSDRAIATDAAPAGGPWDLSGAVSDRGAVGDLLAGAGGDVRPFAGAHRAALGFDVVSHQTLRGAVVVDCDARDAAVRVAQGLRERMADRASALAAAGGELRGAVRAMGSRVEVEWQAQGIDHALVEWLRLRQEDADETGPAGDP